MKTPLAVMNELAQKRLIHPPVCDIEVYGSEHNKTFTCKMSVNGFESITQTASSKEKAKRKATELLLSVIESKIDINAKPKAKIKGVSNIHELSKPTDQQGKSTNIIPFASDNPVSQLLELTQKGLIESVEYHFNEFDIKPQRQYECINSLNSLNLLGKLTTKALSTSKKKAKAQAAQQLLDQILRLDEFQQKHKEYKEAKQQTKAQKLKGAIKTPVTRQDQTDGQQNKTPAALLAELQQQGVIANLKFKTKSVIKDNESNQSAFECICYVDDLIARATSTNKKESKQLAAQGMLDQLKANGIDINAKAKTKANKDFPYLVEQNACASG